MLVQSAEYFARAARLTRAGQGLLETVDDPDLDQSLATSDLEAAASTQSAVDSRQRFTPTPDNTNAPADSAPDVVLAALLLDLQSANVLMSAGIALNEHGAGANKKFLEDSISLIASSSSSLKTNDGGLRFAPPAAPSKDPTEAITLFQDNAERALDSISDGTAGVINSVIENLKKVDGTKVLEAIDNLGKSVDIVAAAGKFIRQGIEKLRSVLDAISNLFGGEAIEAMKKQVKSLWDKVANGNYTKEAVRWAVGAEAAKQRVLEIIKFPDLEVTRLDGVSRELAFLDDNFQTHLAIVKGLLAAVTIAAGILAFLHILGPWLAAATAGAYLSLMAATLFVGMSSTGLRPLAKWGPGVCSLIERAAGVPVPASK